MAEEKYDMRYTRAEKNVMWTIAFVILLLVMVFWGLWYFNRPAATTTETGIATEEATTATGAPVGTEPAGTAGTAAGGESMPETTSPTTTTTY